MIPHHPSPNAINDSLTYQIASGHNEQADKTLIAVHNEIATLFTLFLASSQQLCR